MCWGHFSPGPPWSACTGWCSRWVRAGLSSLYSWTCCSPAACAQTQRCWTPDSQNPKPHLKKNKKTPENLFTHVTCSTESRWQKVVRMTWLLLTIWVYRVIHFLCVVDLCSHISEHMVKEYKTMFSLLSFHVVFSYFCHHRGPSSGTCTSYLRSHSYYWFIQPDSIWKYKIIYFSLRKMQHFFSLFLNMKVFDPAE